MLMVIFGAGASYDSDPRFPPVSADYRWPRPPLANHLFNSCPEFLDILKKYPWCRALIPYLHKGQIEDELARLQAGAQDDPQRKVQLTAVQFYLRDVISACQRQWTAYTRGAANYENLIDQVRKHPPFCFVTFNYDTMLKEAVSSELKVQMERMYDYVHRPFPVFKPHGSVDWENLVDVNAYQNLRSPEEIIEAAPYHRRSDIWRRRGEEIDLPPVPTPVWMPALAIPVATKAQFVFPQDHDVALTKSLREVRKILIVGWKAGEENFLQRLVKEVRPPVDVLAVCGNEQAAQETIERLMQAGVRLNGKADPGGFSDFVANRRIEAFLTA